MDKFKNNRINHGNGNGNKTSPKWKWNEMDMLWGRLLGCFDVLSLLLSEHGYEMM